MSRSGALVVAAAVLVALLVVMGASLPALPTPGAAAEPPTATLVATATARPVPRAALAPTATAAPTAVVAPTATAKPRVDAEGAELVVRDFFAAVDAKDYDRLRDLTSGQARQTAEGISLEVQKAEQENQVTLTPHTSRLEVLGSEAASDGTQVRVGFTIEVMARAGFLSIPVRTTSGEAAFTVENVDGRNLIVNIAGDLS